jgi:molecular chaperone DnaK
MTRVIERNTTIPARRSEIFTTAEDNQPAVDVHVLQGERELARDNRSLGKFKLEGIPLSPRGVPQIEVTFDIDANGILKVSARDKASGKEQTVTISGSSNLDKEEIDRMLKEAEANSDADKKRRQEVEMRNECDSLCYRVERQLTAVHEQLAVHEKARIEDLLKQLKEALKANTRIENLRSLHDELEQAAFSMENLKQAEGYSTSDSSKQSRAPSDDVVDADFEEK